MNDASTLRIGLLVGASALAALITGCPAPDAAGVDDAGADGVGVDARAQDAALQDTRPDEDAGDVGPPTTRTCPDGTVLPISQPCDCPKSLADCDDGDPCTIESFTSSAGGCGTCSVSSVRTCGEVDGCCPSVCSADTDPDCDGCGNGRVEDGEVCDGDCPRDPSDCVDAPGACMKATVEGDPFTAGRDLDTEPTIHVPITNRSSDDRLLSPPLDHHLEPRFPETSQRRQEIDRL